MSFFQHDDDDDADDTMAMAMGITGHVYGNNRTWL